MLSSHLFLAIQSQNSSQFQNLLQLNIPRTTTLGDNRDVKGLSLLSLMSLMSLSLLFSLNILNTGMLICSVVHYKTKRFMKTCFLLVSSFILLKAPLISAPFECKEHTLSNGMKICLVKTHCEKQAVCLEIFALGGTASLSSADRPSGMLAAPLVRESGLGDLTSDQLFSYLYDHAIELSINIKPFDRSIAIHASATELSNCLRLAKDVFSRPRFDPQALQRTQNSLKEDINEVSINPNLAAKQFFLNVNMQHWDALQPLSEQDLSSVDIKKAQHFFQQCFSNPAEFTCVIVGDIDIDSTKSLLNTHLGSLSSKTVGPKPTTPPPFPQGITKQDQYLLTNTAQAIAQITFPVSQQVTPELIDRLRQTCELIHANLSAALTNSTPSLPRFQVKYEFPNFPIFGQTWLLIAFACNPADVKPITEKIITSLQELKRTGPTEEMITQLSSHRSKCNITWEEDNGTLLPLIANIYRWRWDLQTINRYLPNPSYPSPTPIKQQSLQQDLNQFISLDHYSMLTAYPSAWRDHQHD